MPTLLWVRVQYQTNTVSVSSVDLYRFLRYGLDLVRRVDRISVPMNQPRFAVDVLLDTGDVDAEISEVAAHVLRDEIDIDIDIDNYNGLTFAWERKMMARPQLENPACEA